MTTAQGIPVLREHAPGDVVIWRQGRPVTAAQIIARARTLSDALPRARFAINLCESRGNFLIAFLAAAQAEQVSLLPSSRAPRAVQEIRDVFPEHCLITDDVVLSATPAANAAQTPLVLEAHDPIAIVFTSGSTGQPESHPKDWNTLVRTAALARERFLPGLARFHVVATVPPQHMYGFETTVTLIVLSGSAVSDARPLFPADIAAELTTVPAPRLLITTPAHLRACVSANVTFPPLELIISATAPLDRELAGQCERLWNTRVCEIYGCTEAGSMASRRTVQSEDWLTYPQAWVEPREAGAVYHGSHLPSPVYLQDLLEIETPRKFRLVGRSADMVKVAGKRASLAELTQRLLGVAGVADGVVFVPGADSRPAALVVAPGVSRQTILAALAEQLDPAFVPRPLVLVDSLPRTETGKLPRAALLAAIGAPRGERCE